MNHDTREYVIGQLGKLGLTVTDEWGRDVSTEIPTHEPSAAFPYRIREHPMRFIGMITDEAVILFPGGYETVPQDILVQWAIAGILRRHEVTAFRVTPVDDSEF